MLSNAKYSTSWKNILPDQWLQQPYDFKFAGVVRWEQKARYLDRIPERHRCHSSTSTPFLTLVKSVAVGNRSTQERSMKNAEQTDRLFESKDFLLWKEDIGLAKASSGALRISTENLKPAF